MDQLNQDIANYRNIKSSAVSFIAHKNLRKFPIKKNYQDKDLPIQATLGDIYLIKGDNIIQYYSYWEKVSLYTQVNHIKPMWLCRIEIINTAHGDPEQLAFLLSGCDLIPDIESAHYSITGFLDAGFAIYLK